jgi:eukaryotic-like serine/threonine-protein kinase
MQGKTLLHYHLLDKIGEGGMGLVYKARDERLGRLVAVKVLPDARLDPASRSRFFREARAASALNHPNIITIHEIASCDGTEMIVMEYVAGRTLGELLRAGPLSLPDVFSIAVQIADAVAKAHAAGVIHRDLKPGNVMVTPDGLVKVLDFGLAKLQHSSAQADDAPTLELTGAHVVLGTAAYMSPEQAAGEPLDPRTDIFSFGVVLYEMIGGRRPFEGHTTLEVLRKLLAQDPVNVDALRSRAPDDLVQVVARTLAKDRETRADSMIKVRDALRAGQAASAGAVTVQSPSGDSPTISIATAAQARAGAARRRRLTDGVTRRRAATAGGLAAVTLAIAFLAAPPRGNPGDGALAAPDSTGTAYQHYTAGQELLRRHDRPKAIDDAITAFTNAVQRDENYAPGYAGLADAYYRKDVLNTDPQYKRLALHSATRAVELNPDLAVAQLAMGRAMLANGRLDDAESHLRRALELDPGQAPALISLAAVLVARKDPSSAEATYREAVRNAPNEWQPLAELGQFLYKAARYEEAADAWERCASLVGDNATIYRQLGAAYHMLGRPNDAARAFQQALQIEPTAPVYNNLGTLRFFQGQYADAVDAFSRAVKMRANSYLYWGNLGDAHRWNEPTKNEAQAACETAIGLAEGALKNDPTNQELKVTLAVYRVKSGDREGALRDIAFVESASQASPSMWFKTTVVYELAGNRDAALKALVRALRAGYSLREIQNEPELLSMRADPRFHLLANESRPSP